MIKEIENPSYIAGTSNNPTMLICDNCGEGLGINDNPDEKLNEYIKDFKSLHKNCDKPKHDLSNIINEGE